jgi:hypothetical protein
MQNRPTVRVSVDMPLPACATALTHACHSYQAHSSHQQTIFLVLTNALEGAAYKWLSNCCKPLPCHCTYSARSVQHTVLFCCAIHLSCQYCSGPYCRCCRRRCSCAQQYVNND